MKAATETTEAPGYDRYQGMLAVRRPLARNFARQILQTTRPFLPAAAAELQVLDVGCGYGHTALELARCCRHVVGIEPNQTIYRAAVALQSHSNSANLEFRFQGIYEVEDKARFDLVVLDNVFEHLPDQPRALEIISRCLRHAGVAYILVPNKLWPLEVHYHLPFLSYLPVKLANVYLRISGRGTDYTDASYAPTYFRMNRLLDRHAEFVYHYVLPADISLATGGQALHYRLGVAALRRFPWLWAISKAFLIVVVKK